MEDREHIVQVGVLLVNTHGVAVGHVGADCVDGADTGGADCVDGADTGGAGHVVSVKKKLTSLKRVNHLAVDFKFKNFTQKISKCTRLGKIFTQPRGLAFK